MIIENQQPTFENKSLALIGYFYFGQGYSLASLVLLLPLYIRSELNVGDYSSSVAISAIIIIPWYLKVIFGAISDNFPISKYRRKPYLILATLFSLFGWLTIGFHENANIEFIVSGLSIAIGSAMADSVVDGQVVEMTPFEYIGRIQGVAWGSRGLGIGLTGIVSSQIIENFGWQQMFYASSIFGISISFFALLLPTIEVNAILNRKNRLKESFRLIFHRSKSRDEIIFFLLTGITLALVPLLTLIMEREFEFTIVQIGVGSLVFAIGSFFGAVLNGFIFDKSETKRNILKLFVFYTTSLIFGIVFLFTENIYLEMGYLMLIGATGGAFEGYQLKIIQEATPAKYESTGFAVYTGISNLGQFVLGGVVIVYLAEIFNVSFFIPMLILPIFVYLSYLRVLRIKDL